MIQFQIYTILFSTLCNRQFNKIRIRIDWNKIIKYSP